MLRIWSTLVTSFQEDPVGTIIFFLTYVFVILISLILHECAHGWMAYRCGDPTAKFLGRLSLNPVRHLDPLGTLCMLFFGFGWARPVPVNPRNFQNYRRDDFLVSIAGIVTNLTLFLICSLSAVFINKVLWRTEWLTVLEGVYQVAATPEGLVNVFAADPLEFTAPYIAYGISLDWLSGFTNYPWVLYVQRFFLQMAMINLTLAIFNLLPIPPLDGFHVLNDTLLKGKLQLNRQVFQITQFVLILVVLCTDLLNTVLNVGTELVGGAVIRTFLMLTGQM